MYWEQIVLLSPLFLSFLVSAAVVFLVLRRPSIPGRLSFILLETSISLWALLYIFELVAPDLENKISFSNLEYVLIVYIPVLLFSFSMIYTGRGYWLTQERILLLCTVPALTLIILWANPLHGPMQSDLQLSTNGIFPIVTKTYGAWFWFHTVYSYALILTGTGFLLNALFHEPQSFKGQRLMVIIGVFMPWMGNILYIFKLSPLPGIDISVIGFSITGIAFFLGLLRFQLLDLMPIARSAIFDNITDAIIVLDVNNRIVDINTAAQLLLSRSQKIVIGQHARNAFSPWMEVALPFANASQARSEVILETAATHKIFDLIISPLHDKSTRYLGRVIALRDITERKQIEKAMQDLNQALEQRVDERTQELTRVNDELLNELKQRQCVEAALRESEERYSLATRGANDGIWDWNFKKDAIYYSSRWKSMLGYGEEDINSSLDEWLGRIHPDDLERVKLEIVAHLSGQTEDFTSEHRMRHAGGKYIWVLNRGLAIRDAEGYPYRMAGSVSDITSRKLAQEQLINDALRDMLTGLPNRALFMDRLERALERSKRVDSYRFAVFYVDFDRFKWVNDTLGHVYGDRVLIEAAHRLENCVRSIDTVARIGGDEFTILLEDPKSVEDVIHIAERIQEETLTPIQLGERQVSTSTSIGIVFGDREYDHVETILRDADIAMYHAKQRGKAGYCFFDQNMREQAVSRLELEQRLQIALEKEEFCVYYQPILDLPNENLVGFEALVRWIHPQRGMISPIEFIPLAEANDVIFNLGNWVLREACLQTRQWQIDFPLSSPLSISVNLSIKQFTQPSLVNDIMKILRETDFPPNTLQLEITESMLIEDRTRITKALTQLRALGVKVHIDDFGTGYSSLSYLCQLPLDALKIDRSFINLLNVDTSSEEIVRTIISLAKELNMETVAEGVETREQLTWLKHMKCDYAQGFLISKPMNAKDAGWFISNTVQSMQIKETANSIIGTAKDPPESIQAVLPRS